MQLKTKLFRLKAKNNTEAVKSILRATVDNLYNKDKTDLLVNTFLNVAESFLNEFDAESDQIVGEDLEIFGGINRKNSGGVQTVKVFEQKAPASI